MGVNGVETLSGPSAGLDVSAYKKVPVIPDSNVKVETSGISRAYLMDLDYLEFAHAAPIMYHESQEFQHLNKFAREALYWTAGNIRCRKFRAQAKGRDFQ